MKSFLPLAAACWLGFAGGAAAGEAATATAVMEAVTEEALDGTFASQHDVEFDGDTKRDSLVIFWKKVLDYAASTRTRERSKGKYVWYQARMEIYSWRGNLLHRDVFSMREDDFRDMMEFAGMRNGEPKEYFDNFFTLVSDEEETHALNSITERSIRPEEVPMKHLARFIKDRGAKVSAGQVRNELLKGMHPVITYRRNWREDIAVITYSRLLDHSVWLVSPYD